MIDIDKRDLEIVKKILYTHVPTCKAIAFGSRASHKSKIHSDLDIALCDTKKIYWRALENLRDAFSESDISIKVDVVDLNNVSQSFKKIILMQYERIQ
jgi:predicted nucleotidyltransferase